MRNLKVLSICGCQHFKRELQRHDMTLSNLLAQKTNLRLSCRLGNSYRSSSLQLAHTPVFPSIPVYFQAGVLDSCQRKFKEDYFYICILHFLLYLVVSTQYSYVSFLEDLVSGTVLFHSAKSLNESLAPPPFYDKYSRNKAVFSSQIFLHSSCQIKFSNTCMEH